jgi:hypothetical protein
MFSKDSKRLAFSVNLSFGNKTKSAGARSGEYRGCGTSVVSWFAIKSRISSEECEGTLSWWNIHFFSLHESSVFLLIASHRRFFTLRWYSFLTVWPRGKNACWTTISPSKKNAAQHCLHIWPKLPSSFGTAWSFRDPLWRLDFWFRHHFH